MTTRDRGKDWSEWVCTCFHHKKGRPDARLWQLRSWHTTWGQTNHATCQAAPATADQKERGRAQSVCARRVRSEQGKEMCAARGSVNVCPNCRWSRWCGVTFRGSAHQRFQREGRIQLVQVSGLSSTGVCWPSSALCPNVSTCNIFSPQISWFLRRF